MKIALLGSKDFDSLEYHIHDSLTFLGHQVFHIDIKDVVKIPYRYNYWGMKLLPKYDLSVFKKIAVRIIDEKPDLVIGTYRFIHPEFIRMIKAALPKTPVVHVNPDQMTTLEHQQIFASPYDAWFTKEKYMLAFMRDKMKLNAFYLPEALNPRVHKPFSGDRSTTENNVGIDVVTFGTMYPYRAKMVSELVNSGLDVTLFGVPDKRFPREEIVKNFKNEYITGERKSEILTGSKVIFNNFHYAEVNSANVKYFEIAGIGGFQICDYKPVLEEYSALDVKDYTYKTLDEAVELIKHYLPRRELRHEMAEKQMKHFHKHHTYEHRMKEILSKVS